MRLYFSDDGFLQSSEARLVNSVVVKPRPDTKGRMFVPGGAPLAGYVMKRYGGPRIVIAHGTDVVPRAGVLAMARYKALRSPRRAGYHFLLGDGVIVQLESILKQTWHAGRSLVNKKGTGALQRAQKGHKKALTMVDVDTGKWIDPIVDGRPVGNPNAWGPGIELVSWQRLVEIEPGKIGVIREGRVIATIPESKRTLINGEWWHNFDPRDLENFERLLEALYDGPGAITPDAIFRHSRTGLNRVDPGPLCDVEQIALAAATDLMGAKDDLSNEGDNEDEYQEPWEGPARHP